MNLCCVNRVLAKLACPSAGQGVDGAQELSVHEVLDAPSTGATQPCAAQVELSKYSRAFTLFEVLIALAVFCIAVTGLAIALETAVQSSIEARQRVLSRLELESRLAYNMVDPPVSGTRSIPAKENHGIAIEESATPEPLQDALNNEITGLYRVKITTKNGKISDTAEMLVFHP